MAAPGGGLRGLSDGLAELYAPNSIEDYPARVITVASRLIGADSCSYNHIGGHGLLTWRIEPADVGDFARALGISTRTVHTHLQHIYRALNVTSRTEALARIRALSVPAGTPGSPGT
jgi:hypothetical protein